MVVRLFSQNMSNLDKDTELECHVKKGHRIWMLGEIDILTDEQLAVEKLKWSS